MSIKTRNEPQNRNQNQKMILGGIVVIALLAAVVLIIINQSGSISSGIDYSTIPYSRTTDGAFVLGNSDSPITIIEFADFMCPHCQTYKPTINRVIRELVATGQAKFEYRMINTQREPSELSSQLAECADEQQPGAFWKAFDLLYNMASRGEFSMDSGRDFAAQMGLDYSELLDCKKTARQITLDGNYGTQLGVEGTPTVFIRVGNQPPQKLGNQEVTFEQIQELVRQANSTVSN